MALDLGLSRRAGIGASSGGGDDGSVGHVPVVGRQKRRLLKQHPEGLLTLAGVAFLRVASQEGAFLLLVSARLTQVVNLAELFLDLASVKWPLGNLLTSVLVKFSVLVSNLRGLLKYS